MPLSVIGTPDISYGMTVSSHLLFFSSPSTVLVFLMDHVAVYIKVNVTKVRLFCNIHIKEAVTIETLNGLCPWTYSKLILQFADLCVKPSAPPPPAVICSFASFLLSISFSLVVKVLSGLQDVQYMHTP